MRILLLCVLGCLSVCTQTFAQQIEWDVILLNGEEILGVKPKSATEDSLFLLSGLRGSQSIALSEIRMIKYKAGSSKAGQGFVVGLLTGGAAGYVAGLIADGASSRDNQSGYHSSASEEESNLKVSLPIIGAAAGGLIGYTIGATSWTRSIDMSMMGNERKHASIARLASFEPLPVGLPSTERSVARDVAYLKNGSIIRGNIVEMIPDSTVKILTSDSSLFVFRMSEVDRVVQESIPITPQKERAEVGTPSSRRIASELPPEPRVFTVGLHVGIGIPVGTFASTDRTVQSAGAATAGIMFTGDINYQFDPATSWLTTIGVVFNKFDETIWNLPSGISTDVTDWVTVWPMTGVRITPFRGDKSRFFVQGQVGLLLGKTPEVNASSIGASVNQPSATSNSFAYSVGAGVATSRIVFSYRYLYGSPEYSIYASSGAQSISGKFRQPTGIMQLSIGYVF